MTRNHIHFATGLPAGFRPLDGNDDGDGDAVNGTEGSGAPVISGMRNSSTVLIFIDLAKALGTGLTFWRSENGVVLCDGGADGLLPLACFKRVEDREGGVALVRNGVVVGELREGKWSESQAGRSGGNRGKRSGVGRKPNLVVDNPEDGLA